MKRVLVKRADLFLEEADDGKNYFVVSIDGEDLFRDEIPAGALGGVAGWILKLLKEDDDETGKRGAESPGDPAGGSPEPAGAGEA